MNSDQIFDAIEEVAAAKGKAKQTVLAKYMVDTDFQRVITAALDPLVTYGMAKVPTTDDTKLGGATFDETVWYTLESMATRELTGNAAQDTIKDHMVVLSLKSAELLRRIIVKDLRAGFGDSTVNKVKKGFIPTFPYMRCSLPKQVKLATWEWAGGIISQEKADGMFANVNHEAGGTIAITSRQGSPITGPAFVDFSGEARLRLDEGTQTHGEFLVGRNGVILPREESNGIVNHLTSGGSLGEGEELLYHVWDQIPLTHVAPKAKYEVRYQQRLLNLIRQMNDGRGKSIALISTRIVKSLAEAYKHFGEVVQEGREGTIIKRKAGIWRDATSKDQVKLKLEVDVDLKVVGIVPGRVGTKNEGRAGSLTCETSCGQLRVDVTVKNEAMRDAVDVDPDDWIDKIIVVRSNAILNPSKSNDLHSLFLPRMVEAEYRTDKSEADSLQQVQDQFDSAIENAVKLAMGEAA